jgi:hypothetical protein
VYHLCLVLPVCRSTVFLVIGVFLSLVIVQVSIHATVVEDLTFLKLLFLLFHLLNLLLSLLLSSIARLILIFLSLQSNVQRQSSLLASVKHNSRQQKG